jgi:hypothetical protein
VALIVNWRGTDALVGGSAKAPTDDGLESGKPDALDVNGRELLELRELAVNYSAADPCIWLRKNDNTLAKFRPTAGVQVVNRAADLPVPGSTAAQSLKSGDTYLVRYAPDGTTSLNRLVVWDQTLPPSGGWNWQVSPRTYVKQLLAAADVATAGPAGQQLQTGDLQLTVDAGHEQLKVYTGRSWVEVFGWDSLRSQIPINRWAGRFSDLPVPALGKPILDGSTYMVRMDLGGAPLDRMFVWRELTPEAGLAVQTGEWHIVDQAVWVKSKDSDPDNLTDAKNGDLTVTLEKDRESLKVFDAASSAWVVVPATDSATVKRWISSLSLFQGTAVEIGQTVPGAVDFNALPDLSVPTTPALKDISAHYWIFVGTSGYTVKAGDPGGLGRDINGAKLNPGDWLMVSNRSIDPTKVDAHWVVVSGDLLSATRARALYSHETWRPGSYEAGTVIVFNKALWRSLGPVSISDPAPREGVNVAQVETLLVNAAAGLAAATAFTVTVAGRSFTHTTAAVGESAAVIAADLIAQINADPAASQAVKAEATATPGEIKLTATVAGVPFAAVVVAGTVTPAVVTANVTASPWVKIDLASGVRWVATDADRDAITGSPRQDIYFVLSSAAAGGKGALYYYDTGTSKWQSLGGGADSKAIDLTGGQMMIGVGCPIGSMMAWLTDAIPVGWLKCDGQAIDRTQYPELFALLGANVPDFRGSFLRGAGLHSNTHWGDATRAVNSWQEYKTARPTGATPFGTNLYGAHNHGILAFENEENEIFAKYNNKTANDYPAVANKKEDVLTEGTSNAADGNEWQVGTTTDGNHLHTITTGGDDETVPRNYAVHWIVKATEIGIRYRAVTP